MVIEMNEEFTDLYENEAELTTLEDEDAADDNASSAENINDEQREETISSDLRSQEEKSKEDSPSTANRTLQRTSLNQPQTSPHTSLPLKESNARGPKFPNYSSKSRQPKPRIEKREAKLMNAVTSTSENLDDRKRTKNIKVPAVHLQAHCTPDIVCGSYFEKLFK